DMPGHPRRAVADDLFPRARPHAVATDHGAAFDPFARLQRDRYGVAVVDEVVHPAVVLERNEIALLAGAQKYAMNIGTIRDRIGLAKARRERLAEGNARDQLAGGGVAHLLRLRLPGILQHLLAETDPLESAKNVGPELDAGPELAEFGRLLQHPDGKT